MRSAISVIGGTFGWDRDEVAEYRYQPGRTKQAIFAIGDKYFAVSKEKPKDKEYNWKPYSDQFIASAEETVLWVAVAEESGQPVQKMDENNSE